MEKPYTASRRDFIRLGALTGIGTFLLPEFLDAKSFFAGCSPTTPDILGPFYLANAPSSAQLCSATEPGNPMLIMGTVFSDDCITPIPNALVEVWHATDAGGYYTSVAPNTLRGALNAATNGQYSFTSIQPGNYLNGAQYRPRHIHYKVSAPGFTTLITQLYFTGDPYIPIDPWASQPAAAARIIPLTLNASGQLEGTFDIVLDQLTGIETPYSESGVLMQNFPNPFIDSTTVYFNVFKNEQVELFITDAAGRKVKKLISQRFVPGRYQAFWDGRDDSGNSLGAGMYIAVLRIGNEQLPSVKMALKK